MLISDNNIEYNSDKELLRIIGAYIKHHRQNQNKTQAELSTEAGINRSTLSDTENGGTSNTKTLIQILRSLGRLSILEGFSHINTISPLALAEEQAKYKRSRVRHKKDTSSSTLPKSDW